MWIFFLGCYGSAGEAASGFEWVINIIDTGCSSFLLLFFALKAYNMFKKDQKISIVE